MVEAAEWVQEKVKKIGLPLLFVAASIIALQFYFVNITEPIPNFNNATQMVYRTSTDYVVLNPITNNHAIIVTFLVITLVYLASGRREQELGIISHNVARAIVEADLKNLQTKDDSFKNSTFEVEGFVLKKTLVEDKIVPNRYVFSTKFKPTDLAGGAVFWTRHEINPFTGGIERRIKEDQGLDANMLCNKCGGDTADFKLVMSSVIQEMKAVREHLGMQKPQ